MAVLVGVVSDTHGRLTAAAADALAGVDHIIHAGDVGSLDVVSELSAIAPVTAVRGNVDTGETADLPLEATLCFAGVSLYVTHRPADARGRVPVDTRVVVVGHTHRADVRQTAGVTFVNPGSASQPRGGEATIALLTVGDDTADARIVAL